MIAKRTITFFTQSMDRTGSEVVLFNLLKKLDPSFSASLVTTKYNGGLFEELPVTIKKGHISSTLNIKGRRELVYYLFKKNILIPLRLKKYRNSVWYVNTMAIPDLIEYAEKFKVKLIVHVHELEQMYKGLSNEQIERLVNYPQLIIANSKNSAKVLRDYGRKDNIEISYPALDISTIKKDKQVYITFRKKLNIKEDSFVWIMSGSLDDNKNPDLFIDIAKEVIKKKPKTMFIWIGGTSNKEFEDRCKKKSDEGMVSNNIIWLGKQDIDYYNYFNCADGFLLTSKRESFSLATLEALLLGLPVVANDCGGVKEILGDDIGTIVNGIEPVIDMASAIIEYMEGTKKQDISKASARAVEFDSGIWGEKWNAILTGFFNKHIPGNT